MPARKKRISRKPASGADSAAPRGPRRQLAQAGEAAAERYLRQAGYSILARNWRSGRFGEIDLIALSPQESMVVFVEVKARRLPGLQCGFSDSGFDSITWRKQRKLSVLAASYLARRGYIVCPPYRFDIIVVKYPTSAANPNQIADPQVIHIIDAFGF